MPIQPMTSVPVCSTVSQKSRIEVAQPKSKINITFIYDLPKWNFMARAVRFGKVEYVHNIDPYSANPVTELTSTM